MAKQWDFKGWATRHNVLCSDGRTIKEGAFHSDNNKTVPLVWNHNHNDADNVLGHALLEYRKEGVYAYGKFNSTEQGQNAKELVKNGDITSLSIYANKLKQNKGDVIHGQIRELSLVLAGANPGAVIETVLSHADGSESDEAIIFNNADVELSHSDEDDKDESENEQKDDKTENKISEEDKKKSMAEKTIQEVYDTLNDEQKLMVDALVGAALEEKENEGDDEMKQNAFENKDGKNNDVLTHAEITSIISDAKKSNGSLAEAFLAHGIEQVGELFPEARALNVAPELIARDMDWTKKVMAGVSKSPFARVKSTAANLTAEEARAKGYVKGNQKAEEVITALKRVTTPTTIYKLQKLDRDDVVDITDFDVIAFLKAEMRMMLEEELARAILIGDGRPSSSNDKINPINIRPIYGDDTTYTINRVITPAANATAADKAKSLIQDIVRSRKDYKGSGNPTLFTTEDMLVEMLLLEDKNGRVIYETVDKLNTALRVKEIITVAPMEGTNRVVGQDQFDLAGVLVNLADYSVGTDKGGEINLFDGFDLNFNKYEYLIETRCSGALKKPFSAITFELKGTVVAG